MSKKKLIGIFSTGIFSRVQSNLYTELHKRARLAGYNLVLFASCYDKLESTGTAAASKYLYEMADNLDMAAILIYAESINNIDMINGLIDKWKTKNIPIFVYDSSAFDIAQDDNIYLVNPDECQGFAESVRHVIEHHGCERVYMLSGLKDNVYSKAREKSYQQVMAAHGLEYDQRWIMYGGFWERPAREAILNLLESELPIPDAICCANDSMAVTAVKTLKSRGIKVPEDVIVTGFDGIEDAKYNLPAISTCEPILGEAVRFIFDVIGGKECEHDYKVPLRFIAKESCGCNENDFLEDRKEIVRLIEGIRHDSWQNHMLTRMYVGLTDSCDLNNSVEYMDGVLNMFEGYAHLICIRDDIECTTDYERLSEKMRIQMNRGFMLEHQKGTFRTEELFPNRDDILERALPEDLYIFRLIHNMDKVYGYTIIRTNKYVSNEIRLLSEFIDGATNVIENTLRNRRLQLANEKLSKMYDRISEMYIRDTMTGLYNRAGFNQLFTDYLEREDLKNSYVHLLSVDMDGMKDINDGYGHAEGDNAIKAVAKALEDCFAQPCICARYGGDEFAVAFFAEAENEPPTEKIAKKINNYLKKLPMIVDKEYTVGVSVGQAVVKVSEFSDFDSLSKIADNNMYINKRERKGDNVR